MKQLVDKGHFEKLRFWGKIFGTEKNYYIVEAEQNAEDDADDDEGAEEAAEQEAEKEEDDEEEEGEEDPLPKSTYKPPPTVPREERGTGVNKYTYYVCNYRKFISLPIFIFIFIESICFRSGCNMGEITYCNTSSDCSSSANQILLYW